MKVLIVTRHPGVVEWLRRQGITGQYLPRASRADVTGAVVYGVLPVYLAAFAAEVNMVELPRGHLIGDLSADDMEMVGARLVKYTVRREIEYPESTETWNHPASSEVSYALPTD